jgi:hypothetical protein
MAMYVNGTLIVDSNANAQSALGGLKTIQGTSIIGSSSNSHYPKSVSSYQDSFNTVGSVSVNRVLLQSGGLAGNATVAASSIKTFGSTNLYYPFYAGISTSYINLYTSASGTWRVLQPCYYSSTNRYAALPVVRIS